MSDRRIDNFQGKNVAWTRGKSGNPKGRPKGARSILSEDFLRALHRDFEQHGRRVIARVRRSKPEEYLKLIVRVMPMRIDVDGTLDMNADAIRLQIQSSLDAIARLSTDGDDEGLN